MAINESDFHAEYDLNRKIWVVSWKWSGDQTPPMLKNQIPEYPTPKQLRVEYIQELQNWIDNG